MSLQRWGRAPGLAGVDQMVNECHQCFWGIYFDLKKRWTRVWTLGPFTTRVNCNFQVWAGDNGKTTSFNRVLWEASMPYHSRFIQKDHLIETPEKSNLVANMQCWSSARVPLPEGSGGEFRSWWGESTFAVPGCASFWLESACVAIRPTAPAGAVTFNTYITIGRCGVCLSKSMTFWLWPVSTVLGLNQLLLRYEHHHPRVVLWGQCQERYWVVYIIQRICF